MAGGGPATLGKGIGEELPAAASPAVRTPQESTAKKDAEDFDVAAEELANSASGIGDWVLSAAASREWADGQWGGLDRDARLSLGHRGRAAALRHHVLARFRRRGIEL